MPSDKHNSIILILEVWFLHCSILLCPKMFLLLAAVPAMHASPFVPYSCLHYFIGDNL